VLAPGEADKVKERFNDQVMNGDLFVTGNDWEFNPIAAKASEAQFIEQMKFGIVDICRFLGVPADMIDADTSTGSITYANITQRNLQLLIMNLNPALRRREAAFSRRLLPQPRFARFNRGALLEMDLKSRYEAHNLAITAAGRSRPRSATWRTCRRSLPSSSPSSRSSPRLRCRPADALVRRQRMITLAEAAVARRAGVAAPADRPSQRRCAEDQASRGHVRVAVRDLEVRESADGGSITFTGHASVTETGYQMYDFWGPYTEVVSASSFDETLARADLDVPLVIAHDQTRRIARTTNGSLRLSMDEVGLFVEADLDPADADVAYIVPKLRAGLIRRDVVQVPHHERASGRPTGGVPHRRSRPSPRRRGDRRLRAANPSTDAERGKR
jgi:hypothetical protein